MNDADEILVAVVRGYNTRVELHTNEEGLLYRIVQDGVEQGVEDQVLLDDYALRELCRAVGYTLVRQA